MIDKFKSSRLVKLILSLVIIIITLVLFVNYAFSHPEIFEPLLQINPIVILVLLFGFLVIVCINAFVLHHSIKLINKSIPIKDNLLITAYSSIVNFFGPLQSGPGFRAIYLKSKYGIKLKDFLIGTIIFYVFFGLFNAGVIFLAFSLHYQQSVAFFATFIFLVVTFIILKIINKNRRFLYVNNMSFWMITLSSVLISLLTSLLYYIELLQTGASISLDQAIVYGSTANMSLFVAVTPGAIGIREGFLILSQQLHGIESSSIIAANVIDRSLYVIFLMIVFVIIIVTKSGKYLISLHDKTRD